MATLQLRNVPEKVKRALRKRARDEGVSMSAYVLRVLEDELERPTPDEILRRLELLPRISSDVSAAELLEEARRESR